MGLMRRRFNSFLFKNVLVKVDGFLVRSNIKGVYNFPFYVVLFLNSKPSF